ncbi:MAG: bifunctional proline dehydrogenase/L-glutamate gamma-semialdehyde dehydrogenase PutA, partial [Rhodospirillales bacterium]
RFVKLDVETLGDAPSLLRRLIARSGEPVLREAMKRAMRIIGRQFVMGRTIGEALDRAREGEARGYRYSYDMLGEAARTAADAEDYFNAYADAIGAIGAISAGRGVVDGPGVSIKLSGLHPRYEFGQRHRVINELVPRLLELVRRAMEAGVGVCIDAEEAERLGLSLEVIGAVFGDRRLAGWEGLGLAVQAYQKRAPMVIDWLADLARRHGRRLMVRLVKGAYWDTEIKRAQELGLDGFPVFSRKVCTDVSFIACAARLLAARDAIYPMFATHNAQTLAAVLELAGEYRDFEFQRLHGMGESLYDHVAGKDGFHIPCRVYAPVGGYRELLAYLVRRLLENGTNTSFVNRLVDEALPIDEVIADPIAEAAALASKPHPRIPLPAALYGGERRNSKGVDLSDPATLRPLAEAMAAARGPWRAVAGSIGERPVLDPSDRRRRVGAVAEATAGDVKLAVARAAAAAPAWGATAAGDRAACLDRAADILERTMPELMALLVREAGKTIADAVAEVREAVDFCRYYAAAAAEFAGPRAMPGPTGEDNQLSLHGRGVFACISPWNFPLAIFIGQVTAALAAGNAVVAKPAEQTPLMAAQASGILYQGGIPEDVVRLVAGDGPSVGAPLVADSGISGVAFTGSMDTARRINQALAARPGPIIPLIAETGGQNVMIADSTALPEQVVEDALRSAFSGAGQRCSALRVLFVQADIGERLTAMLTGAAAELTVGDPAQLATDVGPVIDDEALVLLRAHAGRMDREARLLCRVDPAGDFAHGTFFAPRIYQIDALSQLKGEVFGPILHVINYAADRLDAVIEAVNDTGYGLTLGIHSRVETTVRYIHDRLRVGNTYVNRNMIGAVVGVQPFGGEGLSGTGPKAGGPRYLHRFATERTLSVNTAA